MTIPGRNNFFLIVRIITMVILIALGIIYYIDSERYIGWLVVITAAFYLILIYSSRFFNSIKSIGADNNTHQVVVVDIRPYTYEDVNKIKKQGVTIIYLMGNDKKGKVNLTEATFQERFPDLKVGETLVETRDDSIPRRMQ
ncbi:MAG: hypothetical protein ACYC0V_08655 [Armatimonadota bacterium]